MPCTETLGREIEIHARNDLIKVQRRLGNRRIRWCDNSGVIAFCQTDGYTSDKHGDKVVIADVIKIRSRVEGFRKGAKHSRVKTSERHIALDKLVRKHCFKHAANRRTVILRIVNIDSFLEKLFKGTYGVFSAEIDPVITEHDYAFVCCDPVRSHNNLLSVVFQLLAQKTEISISRGNDNGVNFVGK